MNTIDTRCFCKACQDRTKDIYRMVGTCCNCGEEPILMLFRAGDKASRSDCPACGCYDTVRPVRLATPNEIPAP